MRGGGGGIYKVKITRIWWTKWTSADQLLLNSWSALLGYNSTTSRWFFRRWLVIMPPPVDDFLAADWLQCHHQLLLLKLSYQTIAVWHLVTMIDPCDVDWPLLEPRRVRRRRRRRRSRGKVYLTMFWWCLLRMFCREMDWRLEMKSYNCNYHLISAFGRLRIQVNSKS